jgi:hypothetical protein
LRLRKREKELIAMLVDATVAEEHAARLEIDEAHAVAFVPVARAFATAFITARGARKPETDDAEVNTTSILLKDANVDTDDIRLPPLDSGIDPQTPVATTHRSTTVTPPARTLVVQQPSSQEVELSTASQLGGEMPLPFASTAGRSPRRNVHLVSAAQQTELTWLDGSIDVPSIAANGSTAAKDVPAIEAHQPPVLSHSIVAKASTAAEDVQAPSLGLSSVSNALTAAADVTSDSAGGRTRQTAQTTIAAPRPLVETTRHRSTTVTHQDHVAAQEAQHAAVEGTIDAPRGVPSTLQHIPAATVPTPRVVASVTLHTPPMRLDAAERARSGPEAVHTKEAISKSELPMPPASVELQPPLRMELQALQDRLRAQGSDRQTPVACEDRGVSPIHFESHTGNAESSVSQFSRPAVAATLADVAPEGLVASTIALSVALGIAPSFGDGPVVPLSDIASRLSAAVAAVIGHKRRGSSHGSHQSSRSAQGGNTPVQPSARDAISTHRLLALDDPDGLLAPQAVPASMPSSLVQHDPPHVVATTRVTPGSSHLPRRIPSVVPALTASLPESGPETPRRSSKPSSVASPGPRLALPARDVAFVAPVGLVEPQQAPAGQVPAPPAQHTADTAELRTAVSLSVKAGTPAHPFFSRSAAASFERLVTPAHAARDFPASVTTPHAPPSHVPTPHVSTPPVHAVPSAPAARAVPHHLPALAEHQAEDYPAASLGLSTSQKVPSSLTWLPTVVDVQPTPKAAIPTINTDLTRRRILRNSDPATATGEDNAVSAMEAVDLEKLLDVHALLVQTLNEVFKRLPRMSHKVEFEDVFAVEPELPSRAQVIEHARQLLSSVHRLLHDDSGMARQTFTTSVRHVAMKVRLNSFQIQRRRAEFADHPQAAAFLDRQEAKMRKAVAQLEAVRDQIATERSAAIADYFRPVATETTPAALPGLLPRRRGALLSAVRDNGACAGPPTSTEILSIVLAQRAASLHGAGMLAHAPDTKYAAALARQGHKTPPPQRPQPDAPVVLSLTPAPGSNRPPDNEFEPPRRQHKYALGDLRAPPAKKRTPALPQQGFSFRPDDALFTVPLLGAKALMGQRKSSPRRR